MVFLLSCTSRTAIYMKQTRGLFSRSEPSVDSMSISYIVTNINGKQIMLKCIAHAAVNYICVVHEVSNDYKISRFN